MGLDTTHDCWHGGYCSFNIWRDKVAEVAGYEMEVVDRKPVPVIDWSSITDENLYGEWEHAPEDPLLILITHSDCDGKIKAEFTKPLADRLTPLVSLMPDAIEPGHIGYWRERRHSSSLMDCWMHIPMMKMWSSIDGFYEAGG